MLTFAMLKRSKSPACTGLGNNQYALSIFDFFALAGRNRFCTDLCPGSGLTHGHLALSF